MGYHPRIESKSLCTLATRRSRNSELWLINNRPLEETILGYVAKYKKRYSVTLYALAIEGNHLHDLAAYPEMNRAAFQRDLNSSVARAVPRYVPTYPGGHLWARRYSGEFVPEAKDIEDLFFYCVLQPVKDGLVNKISEYPGYNCFSDAINGVTRKFEVVHWGAYNAAKRSNPKTRISDYREVVELSYKRIPGYEHLSQQEYRNLMLKKLEERRQEILAKRGPTQVSKERLERKTPGSLPKRTKTSTINSHRPRVLSRSAESFKYWIAWYFDIYWRYKECSKRFRAGELNVVFPPGTYRPPHLTCCAAA